ncbi:MAG TPA: phosphoribosylamine--glycine ligase [Nitrospirae bacterium]|nr:phosphoribosylamine--glycine ligase [Nitrospirota bacterium]HDK17123.1 phosphoribosylamine--glycine ligase [Nitrospirota bacterium]HDK82213.1 phosphoribosylamine--glycine ligase [Nitrospirota bacterium]
MKVLVIGSGGREHALVWKLNQSPKVDRIFCAPGNAGISEIAECISIKADDIDSLLNFARYERIDLTVVGPEVPLTLGIVDTFKKEDLRIFGPEASGAQLEGSKVFSKDIMRKYGLPSAEYKTFTSYLHAQEYVRLKGAPLVIKADGLAAGKGVIVAESVEEATSALKLIMKEKAFGSAGDRVIVEQCLKGEEASFMVLTDGKTVVPFASSQDHKTIFDNDTGPNTGGMGAYSPAPIITKALEKEIMEVVIKPLINGLKREGINYRGVIYAGLMICDGKAYVLEFNCRFGDPETQPVLMRLESDLFDILRAAADGKLNDVKAAWTDDASVCVVLASEGYPGKYEKGRPIKGLDSFKSSKDLVVFHAGTGIKNSETVATGGRVLGVTALGKDIRTAKKRAYTAIDKIKFDGMQYRKDIADKAINRLEKQDS